MSEEQRKKSSLFKKKFVIEEEKRGLRSGSRNTSSIPQSSKKSSIPKDNPLLSQAPSNSIIHQLFDTSKSPEHAEKINRIEQDRIRKQKQTQDEFYMLLKRNIE